MCVIVYKPKNIELPSKQILHNCYEHNKDGVGYTFTNRKNVIVKKGYQDFKEFYNELLKDYKRYNLKQHNLIIHFRIGTSGGLTKEKTQPFKITNNIDELNKLYIKNKKTSIVHNGVFSRYTYDTKNSDTQNYIKDFLYPLLKSEIRNKPELIKDTLSYSKLAMLNYKDNVSLYGEYIKDNDIYYSNNSYNNYKINENAKKYDFTNKYKREIDTKIWSYEYGKYWDY